ncbi:MAG: phosphotransferase [Chitinophagaceae bacterium]|nr:phosphotransferase [Chitinophagaceae bacterium]
MDPRLQRALDRWALADPQPLAGDAGARQYFRVLHPQLGTALVVLHPLDTPEKTDDSYFEFRALQAYLDPLLRVPTIVASDDADRCLLVEDLGDTTLERRLVEHPEEELAWAQKAGWLLTTLAGPLTLGAPGHTFFMSRSFDQPKFQFEWDYCRQNFFQDFLQKEPPRWLDRMMDEVHASLETRAHFFVHRDFHVRNLMVHGDRLVAIDFQDARRGAATYDLASLRYDAYWDWSKEAGRALSPPAGRAGLEPRGPAGRAEPQRPAAQPQGPGHLRPPARAPQEGPLRPRGAAHPAPPARPLPAPEPPGRRPRQRAHAEAGRRAAAEGVGRATSVTCEPR